MPRQLTNIVQAEFFHVAVSSFEELEEDCARRIAEGSRIKTVVRFYDEDGQITKHVQLLKKTEKEFNRLRASFQTAGWLQRQFLRIKLNLISKWLWPLKGALVPLLSNKFVAAVRTRSQVAVECDDCSFRDAFSEELHELRESVRTSRNAWVFIFPPDRLTAQASSLILSAM